MPLWVSSSDWPFYSPPVAGSDRNTAPAAGCHIDDHTLAVAVVVADGDLDLHLDIQQKNEIGDLAIAINDMTIKLSNMVLQINDSAEQVSASGEELTATSDEVGKAMQSVSASVEVTQLGAEALRVQTKDGLHEQFLAPGADGLVKNPPSEQTLPQWPGRFLGISLETARWSLQLSSPRH